jgi:hypothetical protein
MFVVHTATLSFKVAVARIILNFPFAIDSKHKNQVSLLAEGAPSPFNQRNRQ